MTPGSSDSDVRRPAVQGTVTTLFFARYRDLVGLASLAIPLEGPVTVEDFIRSLRARGDRFALLPEEPAVAVNQHVATPGTVISPGDEVALLPPVAGG
jgi:molybdopterin synthase sulfur carrier subunit